MSKLIKCKGCGQEVSPDAKACPKCGAPVKKKTGCLMMIVYGFVGLIALAILGSILSGGNSNKSGGDSSGGGASSSSAAKQATVPLPQDQKAFCDAVAGFVPQYQSAPNELKKSAVRVARKQKIQELESSLHFENWVGKLKSMATTSDGSAFITVQFDGLPISIRTRNNSLSDIGDKTLIPVNSPLFNAISELKEGTSVKVSGHFLTGDLDFIQEESITEEGSMTEPAFVAQFTKVEKAP